MLYSQFKKTDMFNNLTEVKHDPTVNVVFATTDQAFYFGHAFIPANADIAIYLETSETYVIGG